MKTIQKGSQNKDSIWQLLLRAEWKKQKSLLSKHERRLIDAIKVKLNKGRFLAPKFMENFSQGCHWAGHLLLLNKGRHRMWEIGLFDPLEQIGCGDVEDTCAVVGPWLPSLALGLMKGWL